MKKNLIKVTIILSMLLLTLIPLSASADTSGTCGDNLTWTLSNGTLTISGTGSMYKYEDDDPEWYADCNKITRVTFENGITYVGAYAFYRCSNIQIVDIPPSLCGFGEGAFSNCNNISRINITDLNAWFDVSFNYGMNSPMSGGANLYLNDNPVTSVTVPENITEIGKNLFKGCTSIQTVIIPSNIVTICDYAFCDCPNLTTVTLSKGISSIGKYAFDSDNIKTVYKPKSSDYESYFPSTATFINMCDVSYILNDDVIKSETLQEGSSLTHPTPPDGFIYKFTVNGEEWNDTVLNDDLVIVVELVKLIDINYTGDYTQTQTVASGSDVDLPIAPTGYTYLFKVDNTVWNGKNVTEETTVNVIKLKTFDSNSSAGWKIDGTTLIIGGTGEMADLGFSIYQPWGSSRNEIVSVVVEAGITKLGGSSFAYFDKLTSISISDSVQIIGEYCFEGCTALKSMILPQNLVTIEQGAFLNCSSLKSIHVFKNLAEIGRGAFANCNSLSDIYYNSYKKDWKKIEFNSGNDTLTNAILHYLPVTLNIEKNDNVFAVTPTGVENGNRVIFVCYNGDKIVYVNPYIYAGESTIPFTTTETYDKVKVMVWENLETCVPLCEAENVPLN